MQSFDYFPISVYRDERPDWVNYLLSYIQNNFGNKNQEVFFLQTCNLQHDIKLKFLIDYLIETGNNILYHQGYDMDRYELFVSELWGQQTIKYGGTDSHVHKNSQLCGWFFLETPQNGSYPIYDDTRINKQMIELERRPTTEITNATSSIHFNNIFPGTVLMSNSWVNHKLTFSQTDKPTKLLHFVISHKDKLCNI